MTYTHIVSFKYKAEIDEMTRQEAWARFLELKPQCQSKAGKPYIVSVKGAKENISPEGKGHGYHVSVGVAATASPQRIKLILSTAARLRCRVCQPGRRPVLPQ